MHAFLTYLTPSVSSHPDILAISPSPTSISIDQIRELRAFLATKPLSHPTKTAYIYSAHTLTLPAQHALLKVLEEPPGNSHIYLISNQPNLLLPTIISRLQVTTSPHVVDTSQARSLLTRLLAAPPGKRLTIIDETKFTRVTALDFIDHLEIILHEQLVNHLPPAINYELLTTTRKLLKANVNLTLALDHLVLNLDAQLKSN